MAEIVVWPQPGFLCRLNNRINDGTSLCALGRVGEQPVFATDDERLNAAFRPVVGDFQPTVQQKRLQVFLLRQSIVNRLAHRSLGHSPRIYRPYSNP